MKVEDFEREAQQALATGNTEEFVLKWVPIVSEHVTAKDREIGLLELQLAEAQTEV